MFTRAPGMVAICGLANAEAEMPTMFSKARIDKSRDFKSALLTMTLAYGAVSLMPCAEALRQAAGHRGDLGPAGLRCISGLRDEALAGQWRGFRSSRLNLQYRVIYRAIESQQLIRVESVTAHDYLRTGR